jgi:hypothetical protein
MQKNIIWSSDYYFDDSARKEFEDYIQTECGYMPDDSDWQNEVNAHIEDERLNLSADIPGNGCIIAVIDAGRWNGRYISATLCGYSPAHIFDLAEDDNEYYCDGLNVCARLAHHDGTHYVTYRVAPDIETARRIVDGLQSGRISARTAMRQTKSLAPHVAKIYGWHVDGRLTPKRAAKRVARHYNKHIHAQRQYA